jgi:hypothetical protein
MRLRPTVERRLRSTYLYTSVLDVDKAEVPAPNVLTLKKELLLPIG